MRNLIVNNNNVADEFIRKMGAGLSERRLLDEIGKLSCDELAMALVVWSGSRTEKHSVAS